MDATIEKVREFLEEIRSKYAGEVGWAEESSEAMLERIDGLMRSLDKCDGEMFLEEYKRFVLYGDLLYKYIEPREQIRLKYYVKELSAELVKMMKEKVGCGWK
jgi:hypothetical protein